MSNSNMQCCICMDELNLPITTDCGHHFCFLCLKGVIETSTYSQCPLCRSVITTDLDDFHVDEDFLIDKKDMIIHYWMYSGRNFGWWNYDEKTNELIEEYYQDFIGDDTSSDEEEEYVITIGPNEYIIDFSAMMQIKKNAPNKKRSIKRVSVQDTSSVQVKGTAGIKDFVG